MTLEALALDRRQRAEDVRGELPVECRLVSHRVPLLERAPERAQRVVGPRLDRAERHLRAARRSVAGSVRRGSAARAPHGASQTARPGHRVARATRAAPRRRRRPRGSGSDAAVTSSPRRRRQRSTAALRASVKRNVRTEPRAGSKAGAERHNRKNVSCTRSSARPVSPSKRRPSAVHTLRVAPVELGERLVPAPGGNEREELCLLGGSCLGGECRGPFHAPRDSQRGRRRFARGSGRAAP